MTMYYKRENKDLSAEQYLDFCSKVIREAKSVMHLEQYESETRAYVGHEKVLAVNFGESLGSNEKFIELYVPIDKYLSFQKELLAKEIQMELSSMKSEFCPPGYVTLEISDIEEMDGLVDVLEKLRIISQKETLTYLRKFVQNAKIAENNGEDEVCDMKAVRRNNG